jgi:hypothetical protein
VFFRVVILGDICSAIWLYSRKQSKNNLNVILVTLLIVI